MYPIDSNVYPLLPKNFLNLDLSKYFFKNYINKDKCVDYTNETFVCWETNFALF